MVRTQHTHTIWIGQWTYNSSIFDQAQSCGRYELKNFCYQIVLCCLAIQCTAFRIASGQSQRCDWRETAKATHFLSLKRITEKTMKCIGTRVSRVRVDAMSWRVTELCCASSRSITFIEGGGEYLLIPAAQAFYQCQSGYASCISSCPAA
jgi:hypothetical protein